MYSLLALLLFACSTHALPCDHGQKTETACECKTRECNPGQYCNLHMVGGACLSSRKVVYDNIIPDFLHEEMGCDHGLRLSSTKPTNFIPISCANIRSAWFDVESIVMKGMEFKIKRKGSEFPTRHVNGYCELEQKLISNHFVSDNSILAEISDSAFGVVSEEISVGYCISGTVADRKFTGKGTQNAFTRQCKTFCDVEGYGGFIINTPTMTCQCADQVFTDLECMSYSYTWSNSLDYRQHRITRVPAESFERSTVSKNKYLFCPAKTCVNGKVVEPCMCGDSLCGSDSLCVNGQCSDCDGCEFCSNGFNNVDCKCFNVMCAAGNYCSVNGECLLFTDPDSKITIRAAFLS